MLGRSISGVAEAGAIARLGASASDPTPASTLPTSGETIELDRIGKVFLARSTTLDSLALLRSPQRDRRGRAEPAPLSSEPRSEGPM